MGESAPLGATRDKGPAAEAKADVVEDVWVVVEDVEEHHEEDEVVVAVEEQGEEKPVAAAVLSMALCASLSGLSPVLCKSWLSLYGREEIAAAHSSRGVGSALGINSTFRGDEPVD